MAVNPKDERYRAFDRQKRLAAAARSRGEKLIPIIGDDVIDPEFGTGVLKVTPAHDKADFEIGQRHNLPSIDVMNPDGTMNASPARSWTGLDRFEARARAAREAGGTGRCW